MRLVPGPGETLATGLLEPVGVTIRVGDDVDPGRTLVQLWTDLPSLAAWAPEAAASGGGAPAAAPWHAETATPAGGGDFRIAVIPLATGACRAAIAHERAGY